jgi:propanol-preferring alcohol dehydrogenase
MQAAVVHQFRQPPLIEDVPIPAPGHGQVLIKVESSGLCHTEPWLK